MGDLFSKYAGLLFYCTVCIGLLLGWPMDGKRLVITWFVVIYIGDQITWT